MNRIPLLVLFAVIFTGISVPAYGELITDHVVINEVDTNPYGDDAELISEWVELYNPTDSDVDLSGWQIASTTVLKKTLTLPEGTIISPEQILKFTNEKIWFTDSSESVELRNSIGDVIDKTPSITDLKNDFYSWQRSYDAHVEWEFSLANAGASNGKLSISDDISTVEITLSTDKLNYNFDDTAIIQGTVSEKVFVEIPTFQAEPILINVSGPNFQQSVSLYPDSNLNYETTLDLVQVLGISLGTYDVTVTYGGVVEKTSFSVESKKIQVSEIVNSTFSITTDQNEYHLNQLILISGMTSEIIPYESMTFTIVDPNGDLIDSGNLFTADGQFNTSTSINFAIPIYGNYVITAEYGEHTASATFNLIEMISEDVEVVTSNELNFELDNTEYFLNDEITISGSISNFDSINTIYYQVIDFSFFDSNGNPITIKGHFDENDEFELHDVDFAATGIPDVNGDFSIIVRIPPNVFHEGDYLIKAKYGSLIAVPQEFSIISKNSSDELVTPSSNPNISIPGKPSSTEIKDAGGYVISNVKTVIEKTNRITEKMISIHTTEKLSNEQSVKPRVLSGSMITPSKDNISKVNLQVSSESGICIIGQTSDCLVSESTRKPGQIFEVIQLDGMSLNVRYSGPDVRLEKFSILPQSSDDFLPDTNWNVEVQKDDEVSRFYYKVTYKTTQ